MFIMKSEVKNQVLEAMQFRNATKEYDTTKKISDEDFNDIIEVGRLCPSSLGSEPWKFIVIDDVNLREELIDVAPGAVAKLKTASHFLIIDSRKIMCFDSMYYINHMNHV